jgi:GTPase Era involved in 16S rRNA processing
MITTKLFELRDEAERLRLDLVALREKEQASYHPTLQSEIDSISEALVKSRVPDHFKVAVVGQFKTGKSSFVNRLAEERLAGVETNPETAAITLFRHGDKPKAVVRLLTGEEWTCMTELYEESPQNPEAYRVAGLHSFNEDMAKRKNSNGEAIPFDPIDPEKLAKEWITAEGLEYEIACEHWTTKEGKQIFRNKIRKFTSTRDPFHYFVREIVVYAPVPILKDHVELIDTPGLNDTQLYRGQLTEDLLKEVDAILFLTQSGASFSQFDKEFLVRQLRKKRLRHVRLIVTQVDSTYEKAKMDAQEEDEDPPTFKEVKAKEESRLRAEIRRTLDELLQDNQLNEEDGYYYIEQLDSLKVHFTSAKWHAEGDRERAGIEEVREALFEVLSENYRLSQLVDGLEQSISHARKRLRDFFRERQDLIQRDFDPATVRANIQKISGKLNELLNRFGERMRELSGVHAADQAALGELIDANLARMKLLADQVLSEYEKSDIGRHWRSRRSGNWGYLGDLGGRVADKTFPVMESMLNRQLKEFGNFHTCVENAMSGLEQEISGLEKESAIDGLPKINFAQAREKFLTDYLNGLEKQLAAEKDAIIQLLDEFATSELKGKLSEARLGVKEILGSGTTYRQASAVGDFYDDISGSLGSALEAFARKRFKSYSTLLKTSGEGLFPKLRSSVEATLAARSNAIEESIQLQSAQAREKLQDYLELGLEVVDGKSITKPMIETMPDPVAGLQEVEFRIEDDETGYSYESLFGPYLANATNIEIDEPYLGRPYQLENFQRFCETVTRLGNVGSMKLTTCVISDPIEQNESDARLEDLKRLLRDKCIGLTWIRSSGHHNRQINTDTGWIILSDRGLDIYKRPDSRNDFGRHDLAFRKCKTTKIHIRKSL